AGGSSDPSAVSSLPGASVPGGASGSSVPAASSSVPVGLAVDDSPLHPLPPDSVRVRPEIFRPAIRASLLLDSDWKSLDSRLSSDLRDAGIHGFISSGDIHAAATAFTDLVAAAVSSLVD